MKKPFPWYTALALTLLLQAACADNGAPPLPSPSATPTPPAIAQPTPGVTTTPSPSPTPLDLASPTPAATPTAPVSPLLPGKLEVVFPNISFPGAVFITNAGDGTNRLFLVLQPGRIMVFPNDPTARSAGVFLDIRDRVNDRGNEEGLLGLAFDPQYAANGFFYVYYTAASPRRSVVSRFSVQPDNPNRADPASEYVILEVGQPFENHNGGNIIFGPDGFLYIGLGDGGSGGDPQGNGQNPGTLLGSILRIDPSTPSRGHNYSIPSDNPFVGVLGFREETWAYGFRNPWRFSFDRDTGLLWAGDVGQNSFEEIDVVYPGHNYGWNVMEGFHCFPPSRSTCDQKGLDPPVAEYSLTAGNCALIGGYIYRGTRLPALYGAYVYGDHCSGRVWALFQQGQRGSSNALLIDSTLSISSFGQDESGEMYILSLEGGIYRLVSEN